jgi:hypothetical protein
VDFSIFNETFYLKKDFPSSFSPRIFFFFFFHPIFFVGGQDIPFMTLAISCKSTINGFSTIFHIFKEQNYLLLLYKKKFHNRFIYISLYQLNIILFFFFFSFLLFLSSQYQLNILFFILK